MRQRKAVEIIVSTPKIIKIVCRIKEKLSVRRFYKKSLNRVRSVSIILCLCVIMGMGSGCETKEGKVLVLSTTEKNTKTGKASEEDSGNADIVKDSDSETAALKDMPEVMNVLGMPLRDETALLVTVTKYRFSDDYKCIVGQYEYDSKGCILRYLGEKFSDYIEYEYDADGSLVRKTCYDTEWRKKTWELSYWVEYSYVEDEATGQLIRTERKYDADGSLSRESVYDSEDKLLIETSYVENVLRSEYEYDSSEHQSWKLIYDEQGNTVLQYREVYDDAGNPILYVEYDAEGNINVFEGYECDTYVIVYPYWRYENIYDDHGNLIKQVPYDYENNETELREYTYDEKGNLLSEFFKDEMVTSETKYEYDAAGNCIKEINYEYDDSDNLTVYGIRNMREWEWQYDEKNRLTKFIYYWKDPEYWCEYTYSTVGISDEDYPYDKINIQRFFY